MRGPDVPGYEFYFGLIILRVAFSSMPYYGLRCVVLCSIQLKESSPSYFLDYVLYRNRRGRIYGSCRMSQNFVRSIKDQFFVRQNTFATCSADDDAFFSVFRKCFAN